MRNIISFVSVSAFLLVAGLATAGDLPTGQTKAIAATSPTAATQPVKGKGVELAKHKHGHKGKKAKS